MSIKSIYNIKADNKNLKKFNKNEVKVHKKSSI